MENERGAEKWHIASVSWGKDSLAMLLLLIEKGWPLDEVVFYDTGMEFQAIYDTQDRMLPELEQLGIRYTKLEPGNPFLYDMLERQVQSRQKGAHRGYGWCGGLCRWGTTEKLKAIDRYAEALGAEVYSGGLYWDCRRRNAALGKKEKAIQAASVGGVGRDGSRRPCPLL